jgi:hypothetical protein
MLNEVIVPGRKQIATMSMERCRQERTRLKNEISFARGNALWGGPSSEDRIVRYKEAVKMIEHRMQGLEHAMANREEESNDCHSERWYEHAHGSGM